MHMPHILSYGIFRRVNYRPLFAWTEMLDCTNTSWKQKENGGSAGLAEPSLYKENIYADMFHCYDRNYLQLFIA